MKTDKDKILHFLRLKSEAIRKKTGLVYITVADLKEIENEWSEDLCFDIVSSLKQVFLYLKANGYIDNASHCPWCIKEKRLAIVPSCCNCGYKLRNGECNIIGTTGMARYDRVVERLKSPAFTNYFPIVKFLKEAGIS